MTRPEVFVREAERIAESIGGIVAYPWDYHPCY